MPPVEPHFIATTGATLIEQAQTLPALREALQAIWSQGMDEDVAVWRIDERGRARLVLVLCADGRTLELDGHSLAWRYPPAVTSAKDDIDGRLHDIFRMRKAKPA